MAKPIATTANVAVYASFDFVSSSLYTIVDDSVTLASYPPKMVFFVRKWRSVEDYFEVSYNTVKEWCPKCVGLGFLDDISYDVRGQFAISRDERLLVQNLEKFTVTELGSNAFHTFIGTNIVTLIGQRIYDFDFLTSQITQEIYATLAKFKDMQQQYAQTGRVLTKGEQLDQIKDVKVTQDTNDPTIVRVVVTATALSGKPVSYTQYMRLRG